MHDQRSFTRSVQEYMDMRSRTIGVDLTIVLIEYGILSLFHSDSYMIIINEKSTVLTESTRYAHGIQLPQTVVDQPSIQEFMCVCSDLVFL